MFTKTTLSFHLSLLLLTHLPTPNHGVQCSNSLVNIDLLGINFVEALTNAFSGAGVSVGSADDTDIPDSDCEVCSAAQYEFNAGIKIDTDILELFGINPALYSAGIPDDLELSISTDISSEFCGSQLLCDAISGYNILNGGDIDSSCQSLNFGFDIWIPTSCNASDNYRSVEVFYNYGYSFACCDDENCNNNYFDNNECDELGGYTQYLNGLVGCWEDVQKDIALYLLCGISSADNADDIYELTCNQQMLDFLSTFGVCACTASETTGISGDIITELLGFLWSNTCGDIDMTCDNKGELELSVIYTFINFGMTFVGNATSNDALNGIESIIGILGEIGNHLVSAVGQTFLNQTTSTYYTNINVSITTESQGDADTVANRIYTGGNNGFVNSFTQEYANSNFTQTVTLETVTDYTTNVTSVIIDTSDVELSATGILLSTNWGNQDPWSLATIKSGDAMMILTWISMPLFIAVIAQFSCQRKQNMIQFC